MRFLIDLAIYLFVLRFVERIDTDMTYLRADDYWKPKKIRRC